MNIKCDSCGKSFEATKAQLAAINKAAKARKSMLVLTCSRCGMGFIYRLESKTPEKHEAELLHCPVSACSGFVVSVKNGRKTVYSCGECGSVWKSEASIFSEIDSITKRFKYRRKCYRRSAERWLPAGVETEPEDYEELVEKEPIDTSGLERD